MLTQEQNRLLTQTSPGTPGGDLLRRYWQPVALSEEIPPGSPPLPMQVMGEELVLFRDEVGRVGLLGLHCAHRAADLSYGRIEYGGLRCLYHGWLYDVCGNCLEQPGEPAESRFHEKVKQLAYPCQEAAGMVFAYLGPGEPPLLPAYDHLYVNKVHHECNYLQANEGNIDPVHLSFLHRFFSAERPRMVSGTERGYYRLLGEDQAPIIEIEETDYGVRIFAVRDAGPGRRYLRMSNFIFPNLSSFPGNTGGDGYSVNWHVPIDDVSHWKYQITYRRGGPLEKEQLRAQHDAESDGKYHLRRNRANRYLQDREEMKDRTFIGMGSLFASHDKFATEGEGPIQDRTVERLGSTDKAIAASRQQLLRAIRDVQEGRDPQHVVRDPARNDFRHIVVMSTAIDGSADWRTYWKDHYLALSSHRESGRA
jgi:phthalate 4,5-dioxygenase oxygenase subunit